MNVYLNILNLFYFTRMCFIHKEYYFANSCLQMFITQYSLKDICRGVCLRAKLCVCGYFFATLQ